MTIRKRNDALEIDVSVTMGGTKVRHREKFVGDIAAAKQREAEIRLLLQSGKDPKKHSAGRPGASGGRLPLEETLELVYERYWRDSGIARTVRSNMRAAVDFFGAETPLEEIDTHALDRYIASLRAQGLAPATIKSRCACLSKTFSHFHRRGNIATKPHFDLPKVGNNMRDRVITDAETETMLLLFKDRYDSAFRRRVDGKAGIDWHDAVVVLADTGARPSELRRITKANLRGDLLDLKITKTDNPRTIPLTSRALEAVERQIARNPEEPFGYLSKGAFRHAWDWARDTMGLSDDKGFIPYALRHTCATKLYGRTRDLMVVQKWLGHKTIQMTLRYAKLQPDDLEKARDLLQQQPSRVMEAVA